jgi:GMP synthase (glutamine-hydrolysing)
MLLVVDNGSVFTKNLIQFLSQKIRFEIIPFNKIAISEINRFDSFILSGRRQNNKQMNSINSKIINHTISEEKQLLGICYGAEILALTTGGTIRKMPTTQKGITKITIVTDNPLCTATMQAYQSHNYEISQLGRNLVQIAKSDACNYEIIQYGNLKIFGTQFHPEMSEDGLSLIERFIKL